MVRTVGTWNLRPLRRTGMLRDLVARARRRVEPIDVEQRFNFLPHRFRWRGRLWRVRQVVESWEHAAGGHAPRRYFRVLCQNERRLVVYQDLRIGSWHVSV